MLRPNTLPMQLRRLPRPTQRCAVDKLTKCFARPIIARDSCKRQKFAEREVVSAEEEVVVDAIMHWGELDHFLEERKRDRVSHMWGEPVEVVHGVVVVWMSRCLLNYEIKLSGYC